MIDITYLGEINRVLNTGTKVSDRTGVGTISTFGSFMRFHLQRGFPLLSLKRTPFKLIASELLWFLKGNPNIDYLHENNNHIWDEWVKDDGTFGPIYGYQWRSWPDRYGGFGDGIDQIANVISRLESDPLGRRHIVSAWNVADVESGEMALPPCHVLFQFNAKPLDIFQRANAIFPADSEGAEAAVDKASAAIFGEKDEMTTARIHARLDEIGAPKYGLSCQLYQRSCDMFLGVPFNIASYSLLTHMIAKLTNMVPMEFIWVGGDVHIYLNHMEQVKEMQRRELTFAPVKLKINGDQNTIDDFTLDDFVIENYNPKPAIKAPVAV